jgi:hypothetical protein
MEKVKVEEVAMDSTLVGAKKGREGLPLIAAAGAGNEHDRRKLEEALEGFRVKKGGMGHSTLM